MKPKRSRISRRKSAESEDAAVETTENEVSAEGAAADEEKAAE